MKNAPIKVLQLGSPTGLYGAERWILALIKHLDHADVESWVGVIRDCPELEAPLCEEASVLGCRAHIFEAPGRANYKAVQLVRNFIIEQQIDILHTHFYKSDLIGLLAVRGTGCRILSTPHGWSREFDVKLWCYEMLDRAIFPFFDAVAPLSLDLYHPLRRIPGLGRKLHFIQNGVDISEIEGVTRVAPEMEKWRQSGALIMGYIGQLIDRKGLDILMEAVSRLPESLDWRLAVIGEGEKRMELEQAARAFGHGNRVIFFGFTKERLAYLKGFDLFVLPSRLEGIPRCLMESMAAGVTVVASKIPGVTDLITSGKNGMLFPVDDVRALTGVLEFLLTDAKKREQLARAGRQHVLKHFSARAMAEKYLALYRELLASK